ncbi:Pro-cathepsin H [Labeo rohita]|uniref:Pro-cathepsin H n=1 Tax=Labeo rohita TaxID=84645 RepID=A0ABQ8LSJ1_LABRO|nr:Pro-cathepsin H [Labeo rohita]
MNRLILPVVFAILYQVHALPLHTEEDEYLFKSWMSQYNKKYEINEYYQRLQIFLDNKKKIDLHNAGNNKFSMGLNQFSDMTFAEFKKFYLLTEPQNCSATRGNHVSSNEPYPDTIDWRTKGKYVTDVKNQGACGSCWTFSTTGCLESVTAIATGKLLDLAEQQLVDCAGAFDNHGCNGPDLAAAFVKEVVNITKYDEMGMVDAVARLNPVSFAYEVTSDFMHYRDGVYTSTQCHNTTDKVNHAVLAVGYAEQNGTPYWIVKNSWGASWGINGYFYIERGKNMCGLAACSSYPLPLV